MTMTTQKHGWTMTAAVIGLVAAAGLSVHAQAPPLTFKATASVKAPGKSAAVPTTIQIDKFVSDADRDKVVAAVKGASGEAQKTLAAMPDIGYIAVGERKTPIKYAYARSTGGGRLITVVSSTPIYFIGGAEKNAKPKAGYDLGLALMVLDGNDTGDGELAPAVKLKVDDKGAIVTEDYGSEVVRLTKITKGS